MKDTGIKFETLHRGFNFKKIFIGLVVIVAIGSVIILKGSKANYTYQEIIPFAEGEVHIKKYDFKIMAMYKKVNGEYKETDRMPGSDYIINTTESGCYKDSNKQNKDNEAQLYTNLYGEHVINNLLKEDKCYLYFDEKPPTAREKILADHTTVKKRTAGSFGSVVTDTTTGTIYESADASQYDDFGKVYYFAGAPTDNWVKFGEVGNQDIYWRIIRINGDGSIRMIYAGTGNTSPETTGDGTQINTSAFNESYNKNAYVGYMYGTPGASSYAEEHKNSTPSIIKGVIDSWYNETTNLSSLSTKLSDTAGFCGDRSSNTSSSSEPAQIGGTGTTNTYYGGYVRLVNKNNPTFKCTYASNDLYTTPDDSGIGNKKLSVPIGLITADEVVFAGGVYNTNNKDFYLYTGSTYWTMSPFYFYSGYAGVFVVTSTGYLSNTYVANTDGGVRPVINLKADVTLSGSGIISSPYTVS